MKTDLVNAIEILNDLLKINNDRVEGYTKASGEINDIDLKTVFLSMADESRKIASELVREIKKSGGEAQSGSTTAAGKIYRTWMDVKTTFAGKDRQATLNSCEFGEDAAQKAYKEAIASNDLSGDVRQLVRNQQAALKASHDIIKGYRDGRQAVYAKTY